MIAKGIGMSRRTQLQGVAGFAIFAAVGGLLLWRWLGGPPEEWYQQKAREGIQAYASVSMTPLQAADSLKNAFKNAEERFHHGAVLTAAQKDRLITGSAEFLWLYYGHDNPEPYKQWRRKNGY